jgi:GNAT superfamily N-acetyltransferase
LPSKPKDQAKKSVVNHHGAMNTTIQRVDVDSVSTVLPLMTQYCDFYEVDPAQADLEALSLTLAGDRTEGVQLLALQDGEAVGFATVFWSWSTLSACRIGVMNDLFVRVESRGSGAAEALIEACRAECAERGAKILGWQTALDNHRAQAVYDRVGGVKETWLDYWLPVN